MARQFQRRLGPTNSGPADPMGTGVSSFANSLNSALIRNQQNQQKQDLQNNSSNDSLSKALQILMWKNGNPSDKDKAQTGLMGAEKKSIESGKGKSGTGGTKSNSAYPDFATLRGTHPEKYVKQYNSAMEDLHKTYTDKYFIDPNDKSPETRPLKLKAQADFASKNPMGDAILKDGMTPGGIAVLSKFGMGGNQQTPDQGTQSTAPVDTGNF